MPSKEPGREERCQLHQRLGCHSQSLSLLAPSLASSLAPSGPACSRLPAITARSMSLQGHGHSSRCSRLTRAPPRLPGLPCQGHPTGTLLCHGHPTSQPRRGHPAALAWATPGTSMPAKSWQGTGMGLLLCIVWAGDEASLPGHTPSVWADLGGRGAEFSSKHTRMELKGCYLAREESEGLVPTAAEWQGNDTMVSVGSLDRGQHLHSLTVPVVPPGLPPPQPWQTKGQPMA